MRLAFFAMTIFGHRLSALPAVLGLVLAAAAPSSEGRLTADSRELSFYHTHTQERLDVVYWRQGRYVPDALDDINRFLSDFRTGDVVDMDPALLDLIWDVRRSLGSDGTYQIISAYRSPRTNEMLRGRGANSGVARKSHHLLGKAIDVRLEGVSTKRLRDTALALKRGGVGYYAKSDFVHMDTGPVRRW